MKNFLQSEGTTTVLKISNIQINDVDKLWVIDPKESLYDEYNEEATDEDKITSYVRSKSFYRNGVTFNITDVWPAHKEEYNRIINLHETETFRQPFCADDSDHEFEHISDEVYVVEYPKEFYCVIPDSLMLLVESCLDKDYDKILQQIAWEYMLETLPMKVVGTKKAPTEEEILSMLEVNIDAAWTAQEDRLEAFDGAWDEFDDYAKFSIEVNDTVHEFWCGAPQYQALFDFIRSLREEQGY